MRCGYARRIGITLVPIVAFHTALFSGTLRKRWEFDLKNTIRDSRQATEFPVFALRFSPNGRYIATVVHFYESGRAHDRLVIVNSNRPESGFREIEIPVGILDDQGGYGRVDFGWSTSGDSIIVMGKRIPVEDQITCGLRGLDGEAAWTQIESGPWEPDKWTIQLLVLDAFCKVGLKFDLPSEWKILAISPNRRLLCVHQGGNLNIVDPVTRRVIQSWAQSAVSGGVKFAEDGKTICNATTVQSWGKKPMSCWDISSGQKIGEAHEINGGLPFATSMNTSRVVASDYFYFLNPFMDNSGGGILKRRVVWDFRTGKELASWRPDEQKYTNLELRRPLKITRPVNFAISPDGEFIVEGGNGIIRLYAIEP